MKLLGLELEIVRNCQPLLGERTCVIVANHQGYLDIPIVVGAVNLPDYRFLAKSSLFKVPFLGWYLKSAGFIPVYRSEPARAVQGLAKTAQPLAEGHYSVVGFPEGTRTYDGDIQPFKKGMFVMAMNSNVPILPVVISGSYEAWSRRSKSLIKPGRIRVSILEPVETSGMVYEDRDQLVATVRDRMVAELERLRGSEQPG